MAFPPPTSSHGLTRPAVAPQALDPVLLGALAAALKEQSAFAHGQGFPDWLLAARFREPVIDGQPPGPDIQP